jgi:hypothetical protein
VNQNRHSDIAQIVADLETASRDDLVARWNAIYRCTPPKGVGRHFLIGAVAHAEQMRAGGHSRSRMLRRLERVAKLKPATKNGARRTAPRLVAGARLIREWNGSSHTVDVLEDGYRWNGTLYRSLSAIARAITGTRWSGPRFFGLGQDSAR